MSALETGTVVVWQWKSKLKGHDADDASWAPYEQDVCQIIEGAFQLKREQQQVTIGSRQYNIHFRNSHSHFQDDPEHGRRRPVRRREVQGGLKERDLPDNSAPVADVGQCPFCLEPVYPTSLTMPPSSLPCGHYFHGACLTPWALAGAKQSCPVCRGTVEKWSEVPNIGDMETGRGRSSRSRSHALPITTSSASLHSSKAFIASPSAGSPSSSSSPFHAGGARRSVSGLEEERSMVHRHSNDFDDLTRPSPPLPTTATTSTRSVTAQPQAVPTILPTTPTAASTATLTGMSPASSSQARAAAYSRNQPPLATGKGGVGQTTGSGQSGGVSRPWSFEDCVHSGAQNDKVALVRQGLDMGVSPDSRTRNHETPLILAAWSGSKDVVKLLLERRANVHLATREDRTALFVAGVGERSEIVRMLLDHKANPDCNAEFQGRRCLARDLPCVARELRARGDFGGQASGSSVQGLATPQKT